jgi:hypothetical protein
VRTFCTHKNPSDSANAALLYIVGTMKTERNSIPKPGETVLRFCAGFYNNIHDIQDKHNTAKP